MSSNDGYNVWTLLDPRLLHDPNPNKIQVVVETCIYNMWDLLNPRLLHDPNPNKVCISDIDTREQIVQV